MGFKMNAITGQLDLVNAPMTVAALGSTPNAAGLDFTNNILTLQPADATHPGVLSLVAQTLTGDKTFTDQVLVKDGLVNSPSVGFASEPTTGLYHTGAGSIAYTIMGVDAFGVLQVGPNQYNFGFGTFAPSSIGNALNVNYNYNGKAQFNYINTASTPVSSTSFEIDAGANGGIPVTIENLAYQTVGYAAGGGVLSTHHFLNQLIIASESPTNGFIGFAVGGRTAANEVFRMNYTYFTPTLGTSDPVAPEGSMYYNTTLHAVRLFNGTSWVSLL